MSRPVSGGASKMGRRPSPPAILLLVELEVQKMSGAGGAGRA